MTLGRHKIVARHRREAVGAVQPARAYFVCGAIVGLAGVVLIPAAAVAR
jgi:hypothetical protein